MIKKLFIGLGFCGLAFSTPNDTFPPVLGHKRTFDESINSEHTTLMNALKKTYGNTLCSKPFLSAKSFLTIDHLSTEQLKNIHDLSQAAGGIRNKRQSVIHLCLLVYSMCHHLEGLENNLVTFVDHALQTTLVHVKNLNNKNKSVYLNQYFLDLSNKLLFARMCILKEANFITNQTENPLFVFSNSYYKNNYLLNFFIKKNCHTKIYESITGETIDQETITFGFDRFDYGAPLHSMYINLEMALIKNLLPEHTCHREAYLNLISSFDTNTQEIFEFLKVSFPLIFMGFQLTPLKQKISFVDTMTVWLETLGNINPQEKNIYFFKRELKRLCQTHKYRKLNQALQHSEDMKRMYLKFLAKGKGDYHDFLDFFSERNYALCRNILDPFLREQGPLYLYNIQNMPSFNEDDFENLQKIRHKIKSFHLQKTHFDRFIVMLNTLMNHNKTICDDIYYTQTGIKKIIAKIFLIFFYILNRVTPPLSNGPKIFTWVFYQLGKI